MADCLHFLLIQLQEGGHGGEEQFWACGTSLLLAAKVLWAHRLSVCAVYITLDMSTPEAPGMSDVLGSTTSGRGEACAGASSAASSPCIYDSPVHYWYLGLTDNIYDQCQACPWRICSVETPHLYNSMIKALLCALYFLSACVQAMLKEGQHCMKYPAMITSEL